MSFFNPNQPILARKKPSANSPEFQSMGCIDLKIHDRTLFSGIYTCIDQTFMIWGVIAAAIFTTAQFLPMSWLKQAIIWSILTVLGTVAMVILTYAWVKLERLAWLLYLWVGLMLTGIVVTDLAIFCDWAMMLINLSSLWLILSALGYLGTGLAMRSRAFLLAAMIHSLAIFILPMVAGWQFLVTGLVMMSNLLIFAEVRWDRLLPREVEALATVKPEIRASDTPHISEYARCGQIGSHLSPQRKDFHLHPYISYSFFQGTVLSNVLQPYPSSF